LNCIQARENPRVDNVTAVFRKKSLKVGRNGVFISNERGLRGKKRLREGSSVRKVT